ncbi:MAGE-like protein 2 [Zingiber officinale]|uniref:MAGE-like protein 2 n=1 Tax=Zingiber officinale TaxID=94328 RepID=UPI001C4AC2F0|nr:MAGE-like protein 2 [Zingiber officinale]
MRQVLEIYLNWNLLWIISITGCSLCPHGSAWEMAGAKSIFGINQSPTSFPPSLPGAAFRHHRWPPPTGTTASHHLQALSLSSPVAFGVTGATDRRLRAAPPVVSGRRRQPPPGATASHLRALPPATSERCHQSPPSVAAGRLRAPPSPTTAGCLQAPPSTTIASHQPPLPAATSQHPRPPAATSRHRRQPPPVATSEHPQPSAAIACHRHRRHQLPPPPGIVSQRRWP